MSNEAYIREWSRGMKAAIKDFEKRDQRSILRAAARPIVKASRSLTPKGDKVHYRYKNRRGKFERSARAYVASTPGNKRKSGKTGGRKGVDKSKVLATYLPGNLRKSIRTLIFRRSNDVFVGPKQGGKKRETYGGTVASADGYYAQIVFGSAAAFQARVLRPALQASRTAALKKAQEIRPKILLRARQRGIK